MTKLKDKFADSIHRGRADATTTPGWMTGLGVAAIAFLILRVGFALVTGEEAGPSEPPFNVPVVNNNRVSSDGGGSVFGVGSEGTTPGGSDQPGGGISVPTAELDTPEGVAEAVAVAYYSGDWSQVPSLHPDETKPVFAEPVTDIDVTEVIEVTTGDENREYDVVLRVDDVTYQFRALLARDGEGNWVYAG